MFPHVRLGGVTWARTARQPRRYRPSKRKCWSSSRAFALVRSALRPRGRHCPSAQMSRDPTTLGDGTRRLTRETPQSDIETVRDDDAVSDDDSFIRKVAAISTV